MQRVTVEGFAEGRSFEQRELLGMKNTLVHLPGLLPGPRELHDLAQRLNDENLHGFRKHGPTHAHARLQVGDVHDSPPSSRAEAAFCCSIHWSRSTRLKRHWPRTLNAGSSPFWAIV